MIVHSVMREQTLLFRFGWGWWFWFWFLNPNSILNYPEISDFPVFHCIMIFSVSIQYLRTVWMGALASLLIPAPGRVADCTLVLGLLLTTLFSRLGYILNIASMHSVEWSETIESVLLTFHFTELPSHKGLLRGSYSYTQDALDIN